jgi:hypothetical protein
MKWSTEQRQRLLAKLDRMERTVVAFYRVLLTLIILVIVLAAVMVLIWRPWGAGHQGEWFYFSIAVLLALGWAVGQFIQLGRRQRKRMPPITFRASSDENAPSEQ